MSAASEPTESEREVRRAELVSSLRSAHDEYRFNVNLGWDRFKAFATWNLAAVAVAGGLLKPPAAGKAAAGIFLTGALLSLLGVFVLVKGHSYYREARDMVKRHETQLGIAPELALSTTVGMRAQNKGEAAEVASFAARATSWRNPKIFHALAGALLCFALVDCVGAIVSWN